MGQRYFEQVRFAADAEAELTRLHAQGFVVHVMRSTSWVNYLFLTWALIRRGLPPVRAVVNLRRWFTRPWNRTAQRGDFDVRFTYAKQKAGSALIFLKQSAIGSAKGQDTLQDPFPALVELARQWDVPIFLVPELFVWEKWNQKLKPSLFDRIFGSPESPGFLHSLGAFLRNYHRAQFRVGEAINLTAFVREHPGELTPTLARKVRSSLHHHLAKETRAVFGPPAKDTDRLLDEAMRDRVLRESLEAEAKRSGKNLEAITREARRNLDVIAARYSPSSVAVAAPVLNWVFNRIYDGIEVDEAGLERAMKLGAQAPLVLTPSHKSHIDYLVMSYVLWQRGYSPPLVAAGANLSFFPLGPFLRSGGAFFLRRSFKGDAVYTAAFKGYLKKLVHDGIHHEFFPEGGRSRSGKLLQPKLGLFTWLVDAVLEGARDDLIFVPVAIDYEKVVEGASYSAELKGGDKKPEDVKALLSAPKVLAENYGRIHLRFDEPVSLVALMKERGLSPATTSEQQKKVLVRALGHRVMYGISRVSTVTPHALLASALLAHRRRGLTAREVTDRIVLLRRISQDLGAPFSRHLVDAPSDPTVLGPIADALRMFSAQGAVKWHQARGETIYTLEDEKRVELSFAKNTLMNLVSGRAIVAAALTSQGGSAPLGATSERAKAISRLLKFELTFPVGKTFDQIFEETVAHLVKLGLVVLDGQQLSIAPEAFARPGLVFLAELLTDTLESYRVAALAAAELDAAGVDKKELVKRALEVGRVEFLAGRIACAEALARVTLENAVPLLTEQRYLTEKEKLLVPGERPLKDVVAQLDAWLRPLV
ncbi:MAG: 1-acyl-sn-glycerol-3-phosphate acyltransferase [Myxococcaceae bacterium]|nr:1-acyl-sn-glycerol-3-phosphate acyltransferase [Myxococcaceae bacterium]